MARYISLTLAAAALWGVALIATGAGTGGLYIQ
mgnify:CR=1 FL=1